MVGPGDIKHTQQHGSASAIVVSTPGQIAHIRESFDARGPVRRKVAEEFYQRFFELAPGTRGLFPRDMERLHLKLMDTVAALVGVLDNPQMFRSIINQIGRQHARFGVTSAHLAPFGDALLWTLERHFGPAFTPELRQAWAALYEAVRNGMLQAMQSQTGTGSKTP